MHTSNKPYVISFGLHIVIFLCILLAPEAKYRAREAYVPMSVEAFTPPQPQPQPPRQPEPEPEPPKKEEPKPKDKIKDPDAIRELLKKELEKTPTPKKEPTKKPTPTSKPKPTPKPTSKPQPTATPPATPPPTPAATMTPLPEPTFPMIPISEAVNNPMQMANPTALPNTTMIYGEPGADSYGFGDYTSKLNYYLTINWKEPSVRRPERKEYVSYVSFTVMRDGSITDVKLEKSSGWPVMDESVLESVKRTDGMAKLPEDYKGSRIRVWFPFVLPL
ncbi:MAG: TonB family protein [bacterium]|nr:TonB family protein [bacterium]